MKNIADMSTTEILEEYNQLTGKNVKRFADRATGIARLMDARTASNKNPTCPNCGATETQTVSSDERFICHNCSCEYSSTNGSIIVQGDADMKATKHRKTRAAKPTAAKATKKPARAAKPKTDADRSTSTQTSWKDSKTRAARSKHHGVRVGGQEYKSVAEAFKELKLPMGRHIAFRGKLKKEGALTFEHGDKKYNFKIVE